MLMLESKDGILIRKLIIKNKSVKTPLFGEIERKESVLRADE